METNLREANLRGANVEQANLEGAYLKDVRNLEKAIDLQYAHFLETRVTDTERKVIEEALKKRKLFIVE